MQRTPTSESEYLIAKAERCFRLADQIRGGLSSLEVAAELLKIANALLARAVEIDTLRDRTETLSARSL